MACFFFFVKEAVSSGHGTPSRKGHDTPSPVAGVPGGVFFFVTVALPLFVVHPPTMAHPTVEGVPSSLWPHDDGQRV